MLGLEGDEDKSLIKSAFRRLALRYHPDVSKEADAEAMFLKLQKSYLLLINQDDDNDLDHASTSTEGEDWTDHDFMWKWKYEKHGFKKSREQQQAQVRSQLHGIGHNQTRRKRRSVRQPARTTPVPPPPPMPTYVKGCKIPVVEAEAEAAAEVEEAVGEQRGGSGSGQDGRTRQRNAGPSSQRASTPGAHERLGKQLKGLRRAASMRLRKFSRSGRAPYAPEPPMVRVPLADVFHAEAVTEEEKRFLRLARLAQEWRDSNRHQLGHLSFLGNSACDHTIEFDEIEEKRIPPREAMLAAVMGVAIGACTGFDDDMYEKAIAKQTSPKDIIALLS